MDWKYKGFRIGLEEDGTFRCAELEMENKPSLDSIKEEIDRIAKQQIKGTQAYYSSYGGKTGNKVTITSIDKEGYFRYTDEEGSRSKNKVLYQINEHNKKIFSEITELRKEISDRDNKIEKIRKQLQPLEVVENKK